MNRTVLTAAVLAAVTLGCKPKPPANRPDSAALRGMRAPPTNAPLTQPAEAPATQPRPVQLPAGSVSAMLVLRGGRPFSGALTVTGNVSITPDRIRLTPAGDSAVELLYRLPQDLPALRPDSGTATLAAVERTSPADGAARQVVLRAGQRLLLAETWQASPSPVSLDLGNGVRLVQQRVQGSGRYTEAPLTAVAGGTAVPVPIGRVTRVDAAGGLSVFVEISHLLTAPEADSGPTGTFYILRAWVVPGSPR